MAVKLTRRSVSLCVVLLVWFWKTECPHEMHFLLNVPETECERGLTLKGLTLFYRKNGHLCQSPVFRFYQNQLTTWTSLSVLNTITCLNTPSTVFGVLYRILIFLGHSDYFARSRQPGSRHGGARNVLHGRDLRQRAWWIGGWRISIRRLHAVYLL